MSDEELFRRAVEEIEIDILNNEPLTLNEIAIMYASKRITALNAELADQVAATLEQADEVITLRDKVAALEGEVVKWTAWYDAQCSIVDLPAPPEEQGE